MEINDTFKVNAVIKVNSFGKEYYTHFGICKKLASMYGDEPESVVEITMKISDDQTILKNNNTPDADYWGWYEYSSNAFSKNLIYPKRFLLDMCFPGGIDGAEQNNRGKAYRLEIIK